MDLSRRIDAMWRQRGDAYRPRTRHLDEAGRPRHTNRLFLETSPYLLQHAHNPVDWYPWGDEAFDTARQRDCPVLLSVGYATCHWCHVMEEESFEDEAIAAVLNKDYVAVKVDREERPDVDAIYMHAVQSITGGGGWPMTVWLTPRREPFYAGTYFPARDGDRGTPFGFLTLLEKIRGSWDAQRDVVHRSAGELTRVIRQMAAPAAGGERPGEAVLSRAVDHARRHFDRRHGGIEGAPKFPSSLPIRLLLRRYRRGADGDAREMARLTLEKMAAGGIFDQVGGGFHRYSTDDQWRVPHFEKMLYDNALLATAYIEGWQATGDPRLRQVVRDTLDYVAREMTDPDGAFYAAGDADSLAPGGSREEGYFFTWTPAELDAALETEEARIARCWFGVTEGGHLDGRSVLHRPHTPEAAAAALGITASGLAAALPRIKEKLQAARDKRPAPLCDDKILAAWNGLMISAFARAGFAFAEEAYVHRAARAAVFVLERMVDDGRLRRSAAAPAGGPGFLEDYAFFAAGLLDLFDATADDRWLTAAMDLDRVLQIHFEDRRDGGYFMTADDHEAMLTREKPCLDGALPSGNAVALMNLVRLHHLTLDEAYQRRAARGLAAFSAAMQAYPAACGDMLLALDDFLHPPCAVIAVAVDGDADADTLTKALRSAYLPGSPVLTPTAAQAERLAAKLTIFEDKTPLDGRPAAYICEAGACGPPITDAQALVRALRM